MEWLKSSLICFFVFLMLVPGALGMNKTCLYLFYGATCPHCAQERPFLKQLKEKYPELEVHEFEVYYNETNRELWKAICNKYQTEPLGVPMTFIGNFAFVGFTEGYGEIYDERFKAYIGYSEFIEKVVKEYIRNGGAGCPDELKLINVTQSNGNLSENAPATITQNTTQGYNVYLYVIAVSSLLILIGIFMARKGFKVRIKVGGGEK